MRILSEAILAGLTGRQAFNKPFLVRSGAIAGASALGCAYISENGVPAAATCNSEFWTWVCLTHWTFNRMPDGTEVAIETMDIPPGVEPLDLASVVEQLNDNQWTRERIAAWLSAHGL